MKPTSYFSIFGVLLLFLQPLLPAHKRTNLPPKTWSEQTLACKKVYYFMEAQCMECSPAEGQAAGKYVVITPGISLTDYDSHPELLEKFRATLSTRFPTAPALRGRLGLQFSFYQRRSRNPAANGIRTKTRRRI